jgi:hypothetical protein
MGLEFLSPFLGDGLDNQRVHEILLAYGPPCPGAVFTIVFGGSDSSAMPNSPAAPPPA